MASAFEECRQIAASLGGANPAVSACLESAAAERDIHSKIVADADQRMLEPDMQNCR